MEGRGDDEVALNPVLVLFASAAVLVRRSPALWSRILFWQVHPALMYLAAAAGEGKTFRELYVRASPSAREAPVRYETTAADFFPSQAESALHSIKLIVALSF